MLQFLRWLGSLARGAVIGCYLRRRGVACAGVPTFSGPWPEIRNDGTFTVGAHCTFNTFRLRQLLTVGPGAELVLGDYAFLNDGVNICATQSVRIGHHSKLGDMTYVYDTDFHEISPDRPTRRQPVVIGDNVWVGAQVMIMPGSVIGDHSVIAAGSIVTGEIPPKSLAAGAPAKVIKTLEIPDDWIRD